MPEDNNIQTWADIIDVNPAKCDAQDVVQFIYDYQKFAKRHLCITPEDLKNVVTKMIDNEFYNIYRD